MEPNFEGEERMPVPSPDLATHDLSPEMSAPQITDRLVQASETLPATMGLDQPQEMRDQPLTRQEAATA